MSVLSPLSSLDPNRPSSSLKMGLVLIIGVALGGGLGFYLGRGSLPEPEACPQQAVPNAAPAADSNVDSAALPTAPGPMAGPDQPPAAQPAAGAAVVAGGSGSAAAAGAQRSLSATISGSLYATLAKHLEGREADILSAHIGRMLVWWLDARRDVLRGDRVWVIYAPTDGPGQIELLALKYHSTKLDKTFAAYRFQPPGSKYGRYFDEQGHEIEMRLKDSPIEDYEQITELMNLAGRRHHGIDFKTDVGTEVRAPYKTRIMRRNWRTRRNGNCLQISYPHSGHTALFLHLDRVADVAKPGQLLPAGTIIAYSGNTGRSTAPHLHYEMHNRSGGLVNPFDVHKSIRHELEGDALAAFQKLRLEMDARLQGAASGG